MAYAATGLAGVFGGLGTATDDALQACLGQKINLCAQHYADNPLLLDPCIETAKQQCAAENPAAAPSSSVYTAPPKPSSSSGGGGGGGTVVSPTTSPAFTPGTSSNTSSFLVGGAIAGVAVLGLLVAKKKGWIKSRK